MVKLKFEELQSPGINLGHPRPQFYILFLYLSMCLLC